jgi:hypothetical protein
MYWLLADERTNDYELSLEGIPPVMEKLGVRFDSGEFLNAEVPVIPVTYRLRDGEYMADSIEVAPRLGLLINGEVKSIFDKVGVDNVQYFPARLVEEKTGSVNKEYCFANIVGKYSAVDFSKSDLELYDDGDIRFIDKLVLDIDENQDLGHLFRLAEFPYLIIVSDALKEAIEKKGVTGMAVYNPEDYEL